MRHLCSAFCLALCCLRPSTGGSQTVSPSAFQEQAKASALDGKSISAVHLFGTAEWIAGSLHESGDATLSAKLDGSSKVELSLSTSSRTEMQSPSGSGRTCHWTDATGADHRISRANCLIAIPWFAPTLFTQLSPLQPATLVITDDGSITKDGVTYHQISYHHACDSDNVVPKKWMKDIGAVKVFYEPVTLLPSTLSYVLQSDRNQLQGIEVSVVFSDYRRTDGIMLPFHIERYIQRTLQLTLNITNASIE